MEPITRKEEYYDGMINDTPVPDPITREEHFLKDLANKIAQGGGGATSVTLTASGNNLSGDISLADLKTALSNGVVLLSFPTEGDADERVAAEYTDDSTNGLRIGVFSEDAYIVYSVVDDGNGGVTLTVVSEKGIGGSTPIEMDLTTIYGTTILMAIQQFITAALGNSGAYTTAHQAYEGTTHTEIQTAAEAMASGTRVYIKNGDQRIEAISYCADETVGGYEISGYTYLKSASYKVLVYMELGTQSTPERSYINLAGFATT